MVAKIIFIKVPSEMHRVWDVGSIPANGIFLTIKKNKK